ncbi:hypothetical protein KCU65_g4957, partial [Aureobasidium melanogenum]
MIDVLLELVLDSLVEDLDKDTLDVLLELPLDNLLEDVDKDTLDILFVEMLEDLDEDALDVLLVETLERLLDDASVELAGVLLGTSSSPAVEVGNPVVVLLGLLLDN